MKVVLQRVEEANVKIDGKINGEIKRGIMMLIAIANEDLEDEKKIGKLVDKVKNLRIYEDENDKLNLSLMDIAGEILIVSNFTLYGDAKKGTRPSYQNAAPPAKAKVYYDKVIEAFKNSDIKKVETGIFGANMKVSLVNDGPVTIIYEV